MVSSGLFPKMTYPSEILRARVRFAVAACAIAAASVQADQIVTKGRNYTAARVVGLSEGELRFHTAEGTTRTARLGDIDLIIVERGGVFADFNQAEQFLASGEPQRALTRYRRTLKLAEGFWPDLVAARLVRACDAAGQIDRAALNFIRVLRSRFTGPRAAAQLMPDNIPRKRDARTVRAIERLSAALAKGPEASQRALLACLRYDILRRSQAADAVLPARELAALTIPEAARSARAYLIQLDALRRVLKASAGPNELAMLDRAIRDCPKALLPQFLLLKGKTLLERASAREDTERAAWAFLRIAIHFPEDGQTPEALYQTSLALERLGRRDKSVKLLSECLTHARLGEDIRRLARASLERLRNR